MTIPLDKQLACAERELAMRQRAYPRWVADGRMTAEKMAYEIAAMAAIRDTLHALLLREGEHGQLSLLP